METDIIANLMSGAGRIALVAGLVGTGALALRYGGLDPQWQHPPPRWNLPAIGYANGIVLVGLSLALLVPQARRIAGYALTIFLVLWTIVFALPRIVAGQEAAWLAPAEVLFVAAGVWIASGEARRRRPVEILFGLCLITFGAAHFLYLKFTANMIPAFIPFHLPLAALTGAGHIAAGLSVITGLLAWLGSALLAAMFSLFVLLLHIPRTIADPASRLEWTMLFHATALTGAAWLMAASLSKFR